MFIRFSLIAFTFFCSVNGTPIATALDTSSNQTQPLTLAQAEHSLQKSVTFLREKLSTHGGYVWRYSDDD